jgi:UrcA family protein
MKISSGLALLATALLSTSALALPSRSLQDDVQTRTETVKFKAADAATAEGAASLYGKLNDAALRVCRDERLAAVDSLEACVADALDAAVRSIASPMVSALHWQARKPVTIAATR